MPEAASSPTAARYLSSEQFRHVQDLLEQGQALTAYRYSQRFGPLDSWRGTDAMLIASRLYGHLGNLRRSRYLAAAAWRRRPRHPKACYYFALGLAETHGPLATWRFLRSRPELVEVPSDAQADACALYGRICGEVRDFRSAEKWLDRAEAIAPDHPWVWVERSRLLEYQDRYEDSLRAARRALEVRPWYRPGVQAVAYALQLLGRNQEALDLLRRADERLESQFLVGQIVQLQRELSLWDEQPRYLGRFEQLALFPDEELECWFLANRFEVAMQLGHRDEALRIADRLRQRKRPTDDENPWEEVVRRLSRPDYAHRRVMLAVPFVRQHYRTCAPASLASLCQFWSMPVDHLEIAGEICYDGTPAYYERNWAENNGWHVVEFTVTWESTVALIDRGLPFALNSTGPTTGHLQVCMGYDVTQRALLVRDPTHPWVLVYAADRFFRENAMTGPRGMVMVPKGRSDLLEGIELPDADLHDRLYLINSHLEEHRRDEAAAEIAAMDSAAPGHFLTIAAKRCLAAYDANIPAMLEWTDVLLERFPDNATLLFMKLRFLGDLSRREERLQLLQKLCSEPSANPIFRYQYALELSADARSYREAERRLRRVARAMPGEGRLYATLANLWWNQQRYEEAEQLYRWAACLDEKTEAAFQAWFEAARHIRREGEVLEVLEDRFRRFGRDSGQPAETLFGAYMLAGRSQDALQVLEEAMALRPDDGELLVFAARRTAEHGQLDRAEQLLNRAEGKCPPGEWLRAKAFLALCRGRHGDSLECWQRIAELEPTAVDAHQEIAQLLAETGRGEAALDHLRSACRRFPYHWGLRQAFIGWLRRVGDPSAESELAEWLEIAPHDAWALRELALVVAEVGRTDDALAYADQALEIDPYSPWGYNVRGEVLEKAGRIAEARADFKKALSIDIDTIGSLINWWKTCSSGGEVRELLAFVREQLRDRFTTGVVLSPLYAMARGSLDDEELESWITEFHRERPEVWQSWTVLTDCLLERGKLEQAKEVIEQATQRFPLLAIIWLKRADVYEEIGDSDEEVRSIEKALEIDPASSRAACQLADVYLRSGRVSEARATLEHAVQMAPLDAPSHAMLAEVLWRQGEFEAALEELRRAMEIDPQNDVIWGALWSRARQLNQPDLPERLAREVAEKRRDDVQLWIILARTITEPHRLEERLSILERAAKLAPHNDAIYDLLAEILANAGRFDEALAACRGEIWNGNIPVSLRGREAWIYAEKGDLDTAIEKMREIVAADFAYFWGWDRLREWYLVKRDYEKAKEAAEALITIAPNDAKAHADLGELLALTGELDKAAPVFERALRLDPTSEFTVLVAFDAFFQAGDIETADRFLRKMESPANTAYYHARVVKLAVATNDKERAFAAFTRVCLTRSDDNWPVVNALDALRRVSRWRKTLDRRFDDLIRWDDVVEDAVAAWVRYCWNNRRGRIVERLLPTLLERGEKGECALETFLYVLGESARVRKINQYLHKYESLVHQSPRLWNAAGFALAASGQHRRAIEWLESWRVRDDLGPNSTAAINLVLSYRALGRDVEAHETSLIALETPTENMQECHKVWLSFDALMSGDMGAAKQMLATISGRTVDGLHRYLWGLLTAAIDFAEAAPEDRSAAFREFRLQWKSEIAPGSYFAGEYRNLLRTSRRLLAFIRPYLGLSGKLWTYWRWWHPGLPIPLA